MDSVKDAVVLRFEQICAERGIAVNDLAVRAGITPSTVYSMFADRRRDVGIVTIKKLCDGLDLSLPEFFDNDLFRKLEQEIK